MRVLTSSEMAKVDKKAIEELGIPGIVLMENAARGVASVIYVNVEGTSALIVCGGGNNGGDGLAVARNLFNMGYEVEVFLLASPEKLKGDARTNYLILSKLSLPVSLLTEENFKEFEKKLKSFDFVVDAIFGTGLSRPVEGFYKKVIESINLNAKKIVSVDIPSGLSGNTGEIIGPSIFADYTVTFAYPKISHLLPPACERVGELFIVDISIPEEATSFLEKELFLLTVDNVSFLFPERKVMSHKYTFGHLAVIGGSKGKTGAPSMTAESALRVGVGLSTVFVPASLNEIFEVKLTEVMSIPVEDNGDGIFKPSSSKKVLKILNEGKFSAVALGPGLGFTEETVKFTLDLLEGIDKPLVIDADGINALSKGKEVLKEKKEVVITPHVGEFSRLTGISKEKILSDPVNYSLDFATKYGVVVVLKSGRTIIATPWGKAYLNVLGNPGMATAGTGDVLTGVVGGLMAMGISAEDSAKLGVFLHSLAGDIGAQKLSQESLVATDLIRYLPEAVLTLKKMEEKPIKESLPFVTSLKECVGV